MGGNEVAWNILYEVSENERRKAFFELINAHSVVWVSLT